MREISTKTFTITIFVITWFLILLPLFFSQQISLIELPEEAKLVYVLAMLAIAGSPGVLFIVRREALSRTLNIFYGWKAVLFGAMLVLLCYGGFVYILFSFLANR